MIVELAAKFSKSPAAKLDYGFDWTRYLPDTDTIASAEWRWANVLADGEEEPEAGVDDPVLSDDAVNNGGTSTVVYFAGGVEGRSYILTCQITTTIDTPRIDERSILIECRQR